ncbi:hypothetical protein [Streptomyces sp. OE57]|uniref:hypothetical protein n=1 Tax=Streptomyces lacaronensis TaxID=3379885 RepID=UPI0039B72754
MTTHGSRVEELPELMDLRARYERAATAPQARAVAVPTLLAGLYLAVSPGMTEGRAGARARARAR